MKRVVVTDPMNGAEESYLDAARGAGMDPRIVGPDDAIDTLEGFAGLILGGGRDVNPALYGQLPHPKTQEPLFERDALEQQLLREALAADLPVLAICRGMQLLNVTHLGGTLHQHIENHAVVGGGRSATPAHDVIVETGSKLAAILGGAGRHAVNSRHHQAIDRVGAGLVVSAQAPDGVIEGLERPDRRFVVAVQWHPENMVDAFASQKSLFLALAAAL